VLKGEKLAPAGGGLDCIRSLPHGHVEAVRIAMRRLGFEKLIDGKASRERDLPQRWWRPASSRLKPASSP
jgi:hypothetical protein